MNRFLAFAFALAMLPVFGAAPGSADTPAVEDEGIVEPFVVNGDLASISAYPYYAAIVDRAEADPYQAQFCGGAIVSARLVVTAAHCVDSFDPVDVIVGTDRLAAGHGDRIQVDQIHVHPSWNSATARNDVAVLHLASATSQRPVRVVPAASDFRWGKGAAARVVGFGCTSYLNGWGFCMKYPDRLYDADLPVGADSWCASELGADFHAGSMLCAGSVSTTGEASDACYGDSGGPLVVAGPSGWSSPLLVGAVSWGPGCGNSPSAYTRLASYRNWLKGKGVPMVKLFGGGPGLSVGGSYTPVAGDFDGDGRDDILWYAPGTSADVLWRGKSNGFRRVTTFTVNGRYTPVAGDFDGDGRDDILWYAPGTGTDVLWRGTAAGFRRATTLKVNGRYTPVAGDFDGDGRDDILWYGPGTGTDVLWRGTAKSFRRHATYSVRGTYLPVAGDFDGDGRDDILWYAPGTGTDVLWRGTAAGFSRANVWQQHGTYAPYAGDFDGDGRSEVLWYAAGGGNDLMWGGAPSGFTGRYDLQLADLRIPAVGDFNGDGRGDVVLYGRGSTPDVHLRGLRR